MPRVTTTRLLALLLALLLSTAHAGSPSMRPFEGLTDRSDLIRIPPGAEGVVLAEFEEGHPFLNWFPTGSVSTDDSVRRFGASSMRLATDGDGTPVAAEYALPHAVSLEEAFLRLWVRVREPAALSRLRVQVTSDGWESFVSYSLESRVIETDAGRWLRVPTSAMDATVHGEPDLDLIDRIRIRVDGRGGSPVAVHVDRLVLVRRADAGAVSIAFDDGWASQYERAFPIMERFGFRGTAFVVPYLVGAERYMTEAMIADLYAAGWDVAGHYHPSLEGREDPELGHILRDVHAYLKDRGWKRGSKLFAYPQGYFDGPVLVPAVARHFQAARTVVPGLEPLPVADPMRLRSLEVHPDTTEAEIEAALSAAERERAWLILVFHRFADQTVYDTEITPAAFERTLDRVAASGLPVLPMSEVLQIGADASESALAECR